MATTEMGRRELFFRHYNEGMGITVDETIGGLALIVLGILGLARIDPLLLNSIATIVAGIALLVVSAGLSAGLARAITGSPTGAAIDVEPMGSGMNGGVVGGSVGVVLGILALIHVATATLIPVALIIFGAAVLFDFVAGVQMRSLMMLTPESSPQSAALAVSAASLSNTASIIVAVGLVTLGIIELVGVGSPILGSVALLGLGAYLFLEGSAVVARLTMRMAG